MYIIGSLSPAGPKNIVFRFWSVNKKVIPAADNGNDNRNIAVISTDHTDNSVWCWDGYVLMIALMILVCLGLKKHLPSVGGKW